MPYRLAIIVCLLASTGSVTSRADDIYVNNVTGDDQFNGRLADSGGSGAGAVRTISRALEIARRGDRIIVAKTDFPYRECLTIQGSRHSGTDHVPFRIVSDGAILDGTQTMPAAGWQHVAGNVFRFQPDLKSHQQLYLGDRPAERIAADRQAPLPSLDPLQWTLYRGWIYFCTETGKTPAQYPLTCSIHQTGITLYDTRQVVIAGLVVQGFALDGINAHDGVTNAVVVRCTLRGNGRSGLSVGGASRLQLDQSLVGNNFVAQVRSEGWADLFITSCRILKSPEFGPGMERDGGRITVDGHRWGQESTAGFTATGDKKTAR